MTIDITDVVFLYSGGISNNNANYSLGGDPSVFEVGTSVNALFSNISETQAFSGYIDYRCFYVKNTNATDTFFDTTAWITNVSDGSTCELGIQTPATEVQLISIAGTVTGGSLVLTYEGVDTGVINFDSTGSIWAQNFEDALNDLSDLSGVSVSWTGSHDFQVSYGGRYDYRKHDLLIVKTNSLLPGNVVTISRITQGSPINSTATEIATAATPPYDVSFSSPTESAPLTIGTLKPGDEVPIWIKRTTPAGVDPKKDDGFGFRMGGAIL